MSCTPLPLPQTMSEVVEVDFMCMALRSFSDLDEKAKESLENAQLINLHMNDLTNLKGLKTLTTLTSLNLSSNSFRSSNIPELCLLPNLISLDLASNYLEDIVDMPFLPQLQRLSLAYNRVKSLDGIENCSGLLRLDVRSNLISDFLPGMAALSSLPFLVHLDLDDSTSRHSNPITSEYTENIDPIMRLAPDLEFLDGRQVVDWPGYNKSSSAMLEEVKTPKFDKLYQRFKPHDKSVPNNSPDGESSHADVNTEISSENKGQDGNGDNDDNRTLTDGNGNNDDNRTLTDDSGKDVESQRTQRKFISTSTSPIFGALPVIFRDQATSPQVLYDEDTDKSILAMRELTKKLDANLQNKKSVAMTTSPPTSSSTDVHDVNCWDVGGQFSSVPFRKPYMTQAQRKQERLIKPQPGPFVSLSELEEEMKVPLSQHALNKKTTDLGLLNNEDSIDVENIERGGDDRGTKSQDDMKHIISCHSIMKFVSNLRWRRLHQAMMKLWVNAVQPLPPPPPPTTVDQADGSFVIGSLDEPIDAGTQTEEPNLSTFPTLQRELDIVESRYVLQEKEFRAKFLEMELKYKNDIAFKTQLAEAAEKKRVHSMLHLNEEISKLKVEMAEIEDKRGTENDNLIGAKKDLEEQLTISRDKNTHLEDHISDLGAQLSEANVQLSEANVQKREFAAEVTALRDELKSLREQNNDELVQAKSKVESLQESLRVANEALSSERELHSGQNTELIHVVREQSGEIEKLIAAKDDAIKISTGYEKTIGVLKAQNEKLLENVETLRNENIDKIRYLEDKIERQRDTLYELRNVATELRDSREIAIKKSRDLEIALQLSDERVRETKINSDNTNRALNEKLLQLEKDFSSLSIVNGQVAMNPVKCSELEAKIQELEAALKIKGTILDDQSQVITSLKDQKLEMESKLKESVNIIETLDEDIRGLKKIIKDNDAQLEKKSMLELDLRKLIKELSADVLTYDDNLKFDVESEDDDDDDDDDDAGNDGNDCDDEVDNISGEESAIEVDVDDNDHNDDDDGGGDIEVDYSDMDIHENQELDG